MNLIELLIPYLVRVAPGMLVLSVAFAALRPGKAARSIFYIAAFVLLRDAMTPLGLWRLGSAGGALWIRLAESPSFLIAFGLASLAMSAALFLLDRENAAGVRFFDGSPLRGTALGVLGALIAAGPLIVLYRFVPIASRGGMVMPDKGTVPKGTPRRCQGESGLADTPATPGRALRSRPGGARPDIACGVSLREPPPAAAPRPYQVRRPVFPLATTVANDLSRVPERTSIPAVRLWPLTARVLRVPVCVRRPLR